MKMTKRPGINIWIMYASIILPLLVVFDLYVLIYTVKESVLVTMTVVLIAAYLLWFFICYKIETKILSRFICIMKQHPNKELLRVYNNRSDRKDDKIVLAEYHCPLCDTNILEHKNYKDVK